MLAWSEIIVMLALLFIAAFACAANEHFDLFSDETARKFYGRNGDLFEAHCVAAVVTNEVYVIVSVLSTRTVVFAQRITYRIIRSRDAVNESFFEKALQRAIDGDAIEFFASFFFDVAM